MNGSYFQLIVINKIPFMNYFSKDKQKKKELYAQTINFIKFLFETEKNQLPYTIQIVVPPIYLEQLDAQSFREEITEFLEKYYPDDELYSFWIDKETNLLKVLKSLLQEKRIELLASPASFSPLSNVSTSTGIQLQIELGLSIIDDYLDYRPTGFWFPEGNFSPGLDLYLKKENFSYSYLNSRTIDHSDPLPSDTGIAVESPHNIVFFPVEEKLYQLFKEEKATKQVWDKWILDLLESYPSYINESILTFPIDLADYVKIQDELNKSIRYLNDEGYMVHITPETYIKQFSQGMDCVHLCASFLERRGREEVVKHRSSYAALAFLERELHEWRQISLPPATHRVQKQMEKEWLLLSALLYQDNNWTSEEVTNHLEAANKLNSYWKGPIDKDWLSLRESKYPILNTTIQIHKPVRSQKEPTNKKSVLILSWEYPPNIVGGLGAHVVGLTNSLIKNGYEVHLVTAQEMNKNPEDVEEKAGLFVYRVKPIYSKDQNFIHWIGGLNLAMWDKAIEIGKNTTFELVQAHDWLVGAAAISLKNQLNVPLIATIHATEHGRNGGIYTEMQKFIHRKESQLIDTADSLIVCSEYMQNELMTIFEVEQTKINIIPNGVEILKKGAISAAPVENFSKDNKKVVFAMGRLVKEKGFGTLLEAARKLHKKRNDLCFVIAGIGPMYDEYQQFIERHQLAESVHLIGYLQEEQKNALYALADIVVIPSSYEPFGIVALESLVFAIPTIVSQTGGLKGIIKDRETGLYMEPNNAENLVKNIEYLVENPAVGKKIGKKGQILVSQLFSWNRIGEETKRIFDELIVQAKVKESISN
ncbi:glycosyltransferase [Niallia circulans]|uniref:glycosyltransferase n=1 Tax=Niallia circulans TaxID=1397 RepID=UPI00397D609F